MIISYKKNRNKDKTLANDYYNQQHLEQVNSNLNVCNKIHAAGLTVIPSGAPLSHIFLTKTRLLYALSLFMTQQLSLYQNIVIRRFQIIAITSYKKIKRSI